MIKQVSIRNVRNVAAADFELAQGLTLFRGENGAGKSSLLEAIYLLSRAGTFRTRQLGSVVTHGATQLSVKAHLTNRSSLSFSYSRSQGAQRLSSTTAITLREATHLLPTIALTADSLQLLSGPPSDRRSFFDWLVFHVKHSFFQNWLYYRNCLSQRNAVLRLKGREVEDLARVWAVQMEESALAIHESRRTTIQDFASIFETQYGDMFAPALGPVQVSYSPGWDTDSNWIEVQRRSLEQDCRRGRTEHGPHRADLKVTVGDRLAGDILSRGQQKALVMRLYLALLDHYHHSTGRPALILVDDITSELDVTSAQYIAAELVKTQHQVVATILADDPFRQLTHIPTKMFHVKHGSLSEFSQG